MARKRLDPTVPTTMSVLFFLVPLALVCVGAALLAFRWAVRTGQFDDLQTPALRVVLEDETGGRRP